MSNSEQKEIMELAKRRGFFSQTAEAYGGVAGFYTFGPEGAELKRKLENSWRETFSKGLGHREIEAPTIMPEAVFKASGHLDGFDDMIIECPECSATHRADHIVEDNTDIEEAEGFSTDKVAELITENNLVCPECETELSGVEVNEFNLMFKTNIGPGSSNPGYLRPETAQGIFTEFPRLKQYERNQLPFGITQIGKAYRNEISPRKGIVRVREFTQAELEHFIDPEEDVPNLERVKDIKLKLYPTDKQGTGDYIECTVEKAVDKEIIANAWIGYYLGIAKQWYESIGIDMDRFRFRQHNEGERAHYATDCWDAETEVDGDWIEIAGFAYRGCYDLGKHDEHSEEDYKIFKEYEEPITREKETISPDMSYFGPEYGDQASEIIEELERLLDTKPEVFKEGEEIEIELDNENISVPVNKVNYEKEKVQEHGERILPHVAEPSFGVDRTIYSILAHSLEKDKVDGEERTVLHLEPEVAPTEVAVFPLMDKDDLSSKAETLAIRLRESGFSVSFDNTGNIGKRYRRQDEVGTPYCVTIDYETKEDSTVTIRERDTTEQIRVQIEDVSETLGELLNGKKIEDYSN